MLWCKQVRFLSVLSMAQYGVFLAGGGERVEFTIPKIVSWLLGANFNELEVNIMVKTYFWY
jgi:hypothetical protein